MLLLGLLLISHTGRSQTTTFPDSTRYDAASILADFDFLHQALRDGHPAWGHYYPRDSMEHWFAQVRATLGVPHSERAFREKLYPLIDPWACAHTRLWLSKACTKRQKKQDRADTPRRYPPFRASYLDEKLYLTATTDSTHLVPGSEILRINGRAASDIIEDLRRRFTSDGYNQSNTLALIRYNFDGYYRFHFGEWPQYELDLVLASGDTVQQRVAALETTLDKRLAASKKRRAAARIGGTEILRKKGYQLSWLAQDSSVSVMDIRGFRLWRGRSFYRKAFRHLERAGNEQLVIDLRNNGGGAIQDAFRLLSYLVDEPVEILAERRRGKAPYERYLNQRLVRKLVSALVLPFSFKKRKREDRLEISGTAQPRTKHHYGGRVYVLVNGRTFSASVMVSAFLRDQNRAVFIGQETGGGEKGTNAFFLPKLRLPNTGIRLVFPRYQMTHRVAAQDRGRGLVPDYELSYDLEALLEGRDLELEQLRDLVK